MIVVRKAKPEDYGAFSEILLMSAEFFPVLFGNRIKTVLQELFRQPSNLFSFKHVHFAELDGKLAGMILAYDWTMKKRENLRTGFLLFKNLGFSLIDKIPSLLKFNSTVGCLNDGESYLSNLAVYPEYRRAGVGKALILEIEKEAERTGSEKMVLDVENDNFIAGSTYQKLGYEQKSEFSISMNKNQILSFNRMVKDLGNNCQGAIGEKSDNSR